MKRNHTHVHYFSYYINLYLPSGLYNMRSSIKSTYDNSILLQQYLVIPRLSNTLAGSSPFLTLSKYSSY